MCEMVHPALTTVRQDGAQRAKIAMEKLRQLRKGGQVSPEITLPVSLVIRGSTGVHHVDLHKKGNTSL